MRGRVDEGPGAAAPRRAAPSVRSAREAPGWTPDLRAPPAGGEEGLAARGVNTTRGGREAGIASPELFKKASAGQGISESCPPHEVQVFFLELWLSERPAGSAGVPGGGTRLRSAEPGRRFPGGMRASRSLPAGWPRASPAVGGGARPAWGLAPRGGAAVENRGTSH